MYTLWLWSSELSTYVSLGDFETAEDVVKFRISEHPHAKRKHFYVSHSDAPAHRESYLSWLEDRVVSA